MKRSTLLLPALLLGGVGRADARPLPLSVYEGSDASGPLIYTTTGTSQSVIANVGDLNSNLAAVGLGAYSFSSLDGTSNNPGTQLP